MPEPESTHELAEKTERGEPIASPAAPAGQPKDGAAGAPEGEGPPRQVQPDGR